MGESLRNKTLIGLKWTFLERIGTQLVHFIVTVVLARLLSPSDYGVIGMIAVFLSISQMFIDCGFGSALIRKNDRSDEDFSTVFWYNMALAIACYVALFFAAPVIAEFYKIPSLIYILRVLGINLVIQALYTIQVTRLTACIKFGLQAKITVFSCAVSGFLGIVLAYYKCGVWALVGQSMCASVISCVLYWSCSGWRPRFVFSSDSFYQLFGFGSKIMVASFLHTIYMNISPLIIGRKYSPSELGFYARGDSLAALPGCILQSTLGRVIFPVLSSIQSDEQRLREAYKKYLRIVTALVAPTMLILAACSEPAVTLLIGQKWIPCVPYLQFLAMAWVCDPIVQVNQNVLYVKGKSDIVLKLELVKKIIAIATVLISVQFGVIWLCVGRVVYSYAALGLNIYYTRPFIGMGMFRQVREVAPIYVSAIVSAIVAYLVVNVCLISIDCKSFINNITVLFVAGAFGVSVYGFLAYLQNFEIIIESRNVLRKFLR